MYVKNQAIVSQHLCHHSGLLAVNLRTMNPTPLDSEVVHAKRFRQRIQRRASMTAR